MSHWAESLIGKPWVFGAAGPDEFDCWGLARYVQATQFGIQMSEIGYGYGEWRASAIAVEAAEERVHWKIVAQPVEGDLVLMARRFFPVHIGIWINANRSRGVLHCVQGIGVTYTLYNSLAMCGWGSLQYFRHESKCKN